MKIKKIVLVGAMAALLALGATALAGCGGKSDADVIRESLTQELDQVKNLDDAFLSEVTASAETGGLDQFGIDAKTRDNVTVTMAIAAQYRVSAQPASQGQPSGVWRSYYMLANPTAQMRSYLIDALRSSVPQYTLDEVFDKKDAIASDVNQTVSGLMVAYGYDVVSTLITSIDLPADVEQSMNRINSAQREKEAAQSLAEAERIKVVTEARARAEAMEQAGRGIAAQRKAIADGISESLAVIKSSGVSAAEANQLFIFTQWTDMMSEFARNGRQSTVVLPSDFTATASMFEQMLVAQETEGDDEFVIVEEEEK